MSEATPMMQQYQAIKAQYPGAILFFRLGDFYEMFGSDALEASKILEITLTSRDKKSENPLPMCGVPYHSAENYIARLTKAGKKVAICEQMTDPSLPGIVDRKVIRVITPGTTTSEQVLENKRSRFICALFPKKDYFGLAFADLSTGEFYAAEFQGEEALRTEFLRLQPAEIVLRREDYEDPVLRAALAELGEAPISSCNFYEEAHILLTRSFKITTLELFGIANLPFAIQASGILLRYLIDTQKEGLSHIDRIQAYHRESFMPLDEATIRNLELFSPLRGEHEEGTLLSVLDQTQTSMGGRLLRQWIARPLLKKEAIEERLGSVENLVKDEELRAGLEDGIEGLGDLERLTGRLSGATGNARDLGGLAQALGRIPKIQAVLGGAQAPLLAELRGKLKPLDELVALIQSAIVDTPPLRLTEGGIIKTGFHPGLDELHGLMKDARSALRRIEQEEIAATGISTLKVSFNRVFGYYIEISRGKLDQVPPHYIRKQTLVNGERFITPELKEYEEKVLTAEERSKALEHELFLNLREEALKNIHAIKENAAVLAELDVLLSFAKGARHSRYCRPELVREPVLEIKKGRHPVVEKQSFEQAFTPNDAIFKADEDEIHLITGPNMSGKSTYLRQVALIVLMAQIGSFVPAESVRMRVFDRIFTRVGANDNLMRGQSTFMVEMQESATILRSATPKSLIILDEVGRGTSTFDGLSLAWAIFEHLHESIRGFTLFATHYHELIKLAEELPRAQNHCVLVQETEKEVLFLHQIKAGGIDKSYGIEVARLAGLPSPILDRAKDLLHTLENEKIQDPHKIPINQPTLFVRDPGTLTHPALERLKNLNLNQMTPLEALNALNELKKI
ncbi:MAG: DNA mismatch repair protein MutS [Candidatus Gracilibacteria bacterium]|jgi:DNA mismatch repair protein MutS